ncbi:MAG: FAD binding domain-containing protein, partial [Spirochaetales bacterium]|nr:FAD binding domain-containing protein [Spirochaetales bacterium]
MLHEFSYHRPDSLDAALTLLSTYGADATAFSGGTDLLVNVRAGLMRPRHVVDLKGVDKLHELSWSESNGLSIGACVTVNELVDHPVVRERFMILSIAGAELATFQLRNRATVVGNVV